MKKILLFFPLLFCLQVSAQEKTAVSLFMKKGDTSFQSEISSTTGDLFRTIGHHGPAIENQWLGLRIYFDKRVAIDLYSKSVQRLEIADAQWYPGKEQQKSGWGADYYKVGQTLGLGGVWLWDGNEAVQLNPVSNRTARVFYTSDSSYMEMLSEGIPYMGKQVDILLRVVVFNDKREARVEAFSMTGEEVQFVTGINYHKKTLVDQSDNYIATWGIHPEDVAAEIVEIGAALIYNKNDFVRQTDDGDQILLISKPAKYLRTCITSANAREKVLNNRESFLTYLDTNFAQETMADEEKMFLQPSPDEIGRRIVQNTLGRRFGWRYQMACTYYGSLIFGEAVQDKEIMNGIENGYKPFLKGHRKYHKGHVDYNVFGIWPLELYLQTGNKRYLETGKFLADDEYKENRKDELCDYTRFWVDDMYMVGSLQVQAYRATKDPIYLNRAAHQLVTYCDQLQQPNGLFYHRENAPFYWGRGNGWGAAAMAEVLSELPKENTCYEPLMAAYKKMMAALLQFQGSDGMWHQLLDDPESFAETSCTGMFLFSMATGLEYGWLPQTYSEAVESAWNALAAYVNKKGQVEEVCIGTNAKDNKEHYLTRPRITGNNHGQAAVLWAAKAMIQLME